MRKRMKLRKEREKDLECRERERELRGGWVGGRVKGREREDE